MVLSTILIGKNESHLSPRALSLSCKENSPLNIISRGFNHLDLNVLGASSNRFPNGDVNLPELLLSDSSSAVLPVLLLSSQNEGPRSGLLPDACPLAADSLPAAGQQITPYGFWNYPDFYREMKRIVACNLFRPFRFAEQDTEVLRNQAACLGASVPDLCPSYRHSSRHQDATCGHQVWPLLRSQAPPGQGQGRGDGDPPKTGSRHSANFVCGSCLVQSAVDPKISCAKGEGGLSLAANLPISSPLLQPVAK